MSFVIDAKEHLKVKKHGDENEAALFAVETMRDQLAALAGLVLLGEARIWDIKMVADGEIIPYSGGKINDDFQNILIALSKAEEIDFSISYDYWYRLSEPKYEMLGPCRLRDQMEEYKEEELTDFFYSSWYHEDHIDTEGILTAYGENNGKFYYGQVALAEVSEIPSGKWDALHTAIILETEDDFDVDAHPDLIAACEAFKEIGGDVDLQIGDGMTYYLHNILIDSYEKGQRFCEMTRKLLSVVPDDVAICINGFFADQNGMDARLMTIEEADQDITIKVAQV